MESGADDELHDFTMTLYDLFFSIFAGFVLGREYPSVFSRRPKS